MKIRYLKISNILSFKYFENISLAESILFDDGVNIIIGENGSGKSTALEVINFIFKRVIYKEFIINQDLYLRKNATNVTENEKKNIIQATNNGSFGGFRLDPNWDTQNNEQKIQIKIELDEIDKNNILSLKNNLNKLAATILSYSSVALVTAFENQNTYVLDITLNRNRIGFSINLISNGGISDFGFEYLTNYNFYKNIIDLYNLENPSDPIQVLFESFTLIGGYRNYNTFNPSISLRELHASQQIQQLKSQDYLKSLNTTEQAEPNIFNLVKLRVAEKHFSLMNIGLTENAREIEANNLPLIKKINKKLKIVNLECKIKLTDLRTWQYSFVFFDLRRSKALLDINSLSSGQKSIIHLVFEAYGRDNLKGGLIIIDEPEVHLHYQFQNEYLEVIRDLNKEQKSQYILVTHSEALINSSTINNVKRFSLNNNGNTEIKTPTLSTQQKILIKILDNSRSTYAFFAKKVLLVEGDNDRYFYKAVLQELAPDKNQEIAILQMGSKNSYKEWNELFKSFGLSVYFIGDFDCISRYYASEQSNSLKTQAEIESFKSRHSDWETKIKEGYSKKYFILKNGDLEHYINNTAGKDLSRTIEFCNNKLRTYLSDNRNIESKELKEIIGQILI